MLGDHHDENKLRLDEVKQVVGKVVGEVLLNLWSFGKELHDTRKLRDSNNLLIGKIRYVASPHKREKVMTAQTGKPYVGARNEVIAV